MEGKSLRSFKAPIFTVASTEKYREKAFNRLTELGFQELSDPEAVELHGRASTLFGDAAEYEDKAKYTHAHYLYRRSLEKLQSLEEVRELEKGDKNLEELLG